MFPTRVLRHRQPLIRFLGKRTSPPKVDHTPHVHPASPQEKLPDSFATYRNKAIQHGPLGGQRQVSAVGRSGHSLGPVEASKGEYFDRDELPARFRRTPWTAEELDAVDSAGGSLWS